MVAFDTAEDKNAFMAVTAATSLAFFAMVGFEDSVNMAEETKDPVRIFPKMLLTGLGIAGIVYILVSIVAVALVPVGELEASDTPLVEVVKAGAPGLPIDKILPFITMFAVSNTALINMLMASRLIYGMARQHVLPPVLGRVHPRTLTPWVAIIFTTLHRVRPDHLRDGVRQRARRSALLGGTTSLLLLAVFAVVNVAVLVLRRDVQASGRTLQDADRPAGHRVSHLAVPGDAAVRSARCSSTSWRAFSFVIGIVLFFVTMAINRRLGVSGRGHQRPDAPGRGARISSHPVELFADRPRLAAGPARAGLPDAKAVRVVRHWEVAPRACAGRARSGGRLGVTM